MAHSIDLKNKVAFVTGASSGLGAQFAKTLASAGASVVLAARRLDRLQLIAKEIEALGGVAYCVQLDVTDIDSIDQAVSKAIQELGPIDILVNNSGVSTTQKILDVSPQDYDFVLDTNTRGAFFVAQRVAKAMVDRAKDTQDAGLPLPSQRVINIASVAGLRAISHISIYSMSKAAVIQMTQAMALEWGRYGINVCAICPGYISTEINENHWQTEAGQKLMQKLPRKRVGQASDLDGLLVLLASEQSGFMNGSIITADDGLLVT